MDAGAFEWYPKHHRPVKLGHDDTEGAKGAMADHEGHKDHKGFQFKVFSLCYVTSFDEVRRCPANEWWTVTCNAHRVSFRHWSLLSCMYVH